MIIQGVNSKTSPSFSFKNRFGRQLWSIIWAILFLPSPKFMHEWRSFLLRSFGAKIGAGVHVYPSAKIWAPWNLSIGDYVGVGEGTNLYSMALITIGDYAVISQGAHICAGSHDYNTANFQLIASPIKIEAHAWVCADVFIGMGVVVSQGSVIAARSVVVKDLVEPWAVYAGHPAKKVKERIRHV